MKKWIALVLVLALSASLGACGKKEEAPAAVEAETLAESQAEADAATEAAAAATTAEAVSAPAGETPAVTEAAEAEDSEESAEEEESPGEETAAGDGAVENNGPPSEEDNTLRLAAASNLQIILDEQLLPQFEEQYPDIQVEVVYGSSELLKNQIEKGSNYDLFFCASKKPMSTLVEEGLIVEDSVHFLMSNELVLFIPRTSRLGIAEVTDVSKANSIGIGDPADVPVGEYTIEMLKEQELWDSIREKDVYLSSSTEELLQWVIDGTVDCGFAYKNDVIAHLDQLFAVEGFAPTTYRIGTLGRTAKLEAATAFTDFLASDAVLAQFAAYGFTLPES